MHLSLAYSTGFRGAYACTLPPPQGDGFGAPTAYYKDPQRALRTVSLPKRCKMLGDSCVDTAPPPKMSSPRRSHSALSVATSPDML
jgi:hypothetical protein